MKLVTINQKAAKAFIAERHRHHGPPVGDIFRYGAEKSGDLVGVVTVGRPVSRVLAARGGIVEATRLCTDGTRNACSFLYAAAAREAKRRGYGKIITYILESENGASLRAAGWIYEVPVRGHSWNCSSRPREDKAPICDKQRWAKILRKDVSASSAP